MEVGWLVELREGTKVTRRTLDGASASVLHTFPPHTCNLAHVVHPLNTLKPSPFARALHFSSSLFLLLSLSRL